MPYRYGAELEDDIQDPVLYQHLFMMLVSFYHNMSLRDDLQQASDLSLDEHARSIGSGMATAIGFPYVLKTTSDKDRVRRQRQQKQRRVEAIEDTLGVTSRHGNVLHQDDRWQRLTTGQAFRFQTLEPYQASSETYGDTVRNNTNGSGGAFVGSTGTLYAASALSATQDIPFLSDDLELATSLGLAAGAMMGQAYTGLLAAEADADRRAEQNAVEYFDYKIDIYTAQP